MEERWDREEKEWREIEERLIRQREERRIREREEQLALYWRGRERQEIETYHVSNVN